MKPKNKRSVIDLQRLATLKSPDVVYVISCYDDEYFCTTHAEGCWRGFFSLYLQAVYGIVFAKRVGIPYYIDFANLVYRYTDENKIYDQNFWNNYFEQKQADNQLKKIINIRSENYPLRIWNKKFIKTLHEQAVSEIVLKSESKQSIGKINSQFHGLKVLGVHIRRTDHFNEVAPANINVYFKVVDSRLRHYDKLFIATDDEHTLKNFVARYPDKIIYNHVIRSTGSLAVHADMKQGDRYKLGNDALLDCYSLAACNEAILSPSNLSYVVLLINPELTYQLVESWPAKWKRWETLIVFYLDKWNIRKW